MNISSGKKDDIILRSGRFSVTARGPIEACAQEERHDSWKVLRIDIACLCERIVQRTLCRKRATLELTYGCLKCYVYSTGMAYETGTPEQSRDIHTTFFSRPYTWHSDATTYSMLYTQVLGTHGNLSSDGRMVFPPVVSTRPPSGPRSLVGIPVVLRGGVCQSCPHHSLRYVQIVLMSVGEGTQSLWHSRPLELPVVWQA